ncbi:MAG: four helix bundle protein [Chitinophagaceae bacterium]|nr:four helix bundle protein [Chitinophagaceae bacterium]
MIKRFEDLIAWQKAQKLAIDIYGAFSTIKDYGFRDQITRASVSISNNIAEGFDRNSKADFARFLYFSFSSCSEVRSMLYLAKKLNYISSESRVNIMNKANEVSKILTGLIKAVKTND